MLTHLKLTKDILRLRVLLAFLQEDNGSSSVMSVSRTLGEAHYTISRVVSSLEKEGLLTRESVRVKPYLTEKGRQEAERYAQRIEIAQNHLVFEGVPILTAQYDAMIFALYNSDDTMNMMRDSGEIYRVKSLMREKKIFSGAELCREMADGVYTVPFILYREHVKNGNNISMANEGFEHPCRLIIKDCKGIFQLKAVQITQKSAHNGATMSGKVSLVKYFNSGLFVSAEKNCDMISIPADVLQFRNVGTGIGQIMHGNICLKMRCSVGILHMPESTAFLTVLM